MDTMLIIGGALCVLTGIVGSVVPVLPGPALGYLGLIVTQFSSRHPFSVKMLVILAVVTLVVSLLDYIIPVYGAKKLQGTKYGIRGCVIGLLLGALLLFPIGLFIGAILGALVGEMIGGKSLHQAIRPALGSLLGFLAGAVIRVLLSLSIALYFGVVVFEAYFS